MLSRYVSSKETMFVQSDASLTQLQTKQLTAKHTGNWLSCTKFKRDNLLLSRQKQRYAMR